jgi:hypothetical protein
MSVNRRASIAQNKRVMHFDRELSRILSKTLLSNLDIFQSMLYNGGYNNDV